MTTTARDATVAESLQQIIFAGVALTTVAIGATRPGLELTFPQWRVLVILSRDPAGVRISEIARRVGVTIPATSRQMRRLEQRGLVVIFPDDRDRRASLARLTAAGREVQDAILADRAARIAEIAAPFEGDEVLREAVRMLAEAFRGVD